MLQVEGTRVVAFHLKARQREILAINSVLVRHDVMSADEKTSTDRHGDCCRSSFDHPFGGEGVSDTEPSFHSDHRRDESRDVHEPVQGVDPAVGDVGRQGTVHFKLAFHLRVEVFDEIQKHVRCDEKVGTS